MKLTDRQTAPNITLDGTFIHVVNSYDTIQDPAGSSYKSPLSLLKPLIVGSEDTEVIGNNSTAIGRETVSFGDYSFASGENSIASGTTSFIHSKDSVVLGNRSVVLGGQNITGTTDDTVYVPYLNIRNVDNGISTQTLGVDANGNVIESINNNKIIVIDGTYGNDLTGEAYRMDRPFATFSAAKNVAVAGDTIMIMPGNYTMNCELKDGVNVSCVGDVNITGYIWDVNQPVTCKWFGKANINYTSSSAISFENSGSNVYIELGIINVANIPIFIRGAKVVLRCDKIIDFNQNYCINLRTSCDVDIEVRDSLITRNPMTGNKSNLIHFGGPPSNEYSGNAKIKIKEIVIGDSTLDHVGTLIGGAANSNAYAYIEIDRVISNYTLTNTGVTDFESFPLISEVGIGPYTIHIKINDYVRVKTKPCIVRRTSFSNNGKMIIEGRFISESREVVRLGANISQTIFKNAILERLSDGADSNAVVVLGNPTVANIPSGAGGIQTDNLNVEFRDTTIIKRSNGGDNSAMVVFDGPSSNIFFHNSDIIMSGTIASGSTACDADTLPEGEVYFRNVVSNLDNTANVVNISTTSGFTGNDIFLTTFF